MTCVDDNEASAFVEGRLSPEAVSRVESHLDSCASCRQRVSMMAQLVSRSITDADVAPISEEDAALRAAGTTGRYVVLDTLGTGGIGVVYAAYDPQLRRRVALKVLRPEMDVLDSDSGPRLLHEAQAMARLQHPNVIAIHDVGTASGRVFLAMELPTGMTLRAWLKAEKRSTEDILAKLIQAGQGLAAAHAAGLVHRDFKLDNVLVGDDGRVRVTDFGLARSLPTAPPIDADGLAAGDADDDRGDQLSFCVTLHEALCGEPPGDASAAMPVLPRHVARVLRRGLDADPARRFPSMVVLLAELDRRTRGSWRNRALVSGLAVAVILALGYMAATRRHDLLCKGASEQLRDVWDARRAEAVRRAFVATGMTYAESAFQSVSLALDRRARAWAAAHTEACEATRLRGVQSEELLSLRMVCLDHRRKELATFSDVLVHADAKVVANAPLAVERLSDLDACADRKGLLTRRPQSRSSSARGQLDAVAAALAQSGAYDVIGHYEQALAFAQSALGQARVVGDHASLADALFAVGRAQLDTGERHAAEETLAEAVLEAEAAGLDEVKTRALFIWIRIVGRSRSADAHEGVRRAAAAIERLGGDSKLKVELLATEATLSEVEGHYADQLESIRQALALQESRGLSDPLEQAQLIGAMSSALIYLGRPAQALTEAQRALALQERALGPNHPLVARSLQSVGAALLDQGQAEDALVPLQRALQIWEASAAENLDTARTLDALGIAWGQLRRFDEADRAFARALTIFEKTAGPDHLLLANTLQNLGALRNEQGRLRDAAPIFSRAIVILERAHGPVHPDLAFPLLNLAEVSHRLGQRSAELSYARRALSIASQTPDHVVYADTLRALGKAYLGYDDPAARPIFERAIVALERQPHQTQALAETKFDLARALWSSRHDRERARQLANEARAGFVDLHADSQAREVQHWLADRRGP
jgi:tetratricopeptide (TPR) repeat protein